MSARMVEALDVLDYCSQGCQPEAFAVTVWDGEHCTCCGGEWGGVSAGTCRGRHIEGWAELLDAEQATNR